MGKKGKKQQDNFWDDDFEKTLAVVAENGPEAVKQQPQAPPSHSVEDLAEEFGGLMSTISKSSKKKEKKKGAKENAEETEADEQFAESQEPAAKEEVKTEVKIEEPKPKAKGGKKIAALRKQIEERKRLEEEAKRLQEEAERQAEEEERLALEAEREAEEERQREEEAERQRLEEQRAKKGSALSEAEKQELVRQKLQSSRVVGSVKGLTEPQQPNGVQPHVNGDQRKPHHQQSRRKKWPGAFVKVQAEEKAIRPAVEATIESPKAETKVEPPEAIPEDDVVDNWEDELGEESATNPPPKATATAENARSEPLAKPTTNGVIRDHPVDEESSDESLTDEDDIEDDEDAKGMTATQKLVASKRAEAAERREKARTEALAARSKDNLRSPICCILGHVDTGKTKLLDKIRQTNVQEGEAGGITQQIGATFFPMDAIRTKTEVLKLDVEYKLPGLLVIDTPGHESFTNLRSRGSSLCNIAILVIDIMHGLEPQTIESIGLLKQRKCPFVVALNKIDRLYNWKPIPNSGFRETFDHQAKSVQREFRDRMGKVQLQLSEQGLNSALFYENQNQSRYVSLLPTSAHTGEGIPDLLNILVVLTQQRMTEKLMYLSELECTVLEVKVIEGFGTTIDVVLSNGVLHESDRIVLCGLNGPIATNIRALLTPEPMKEMRVKSAFVHHKEVRAALGVKISAHDLDKAIAGSRLLVVGPDDDEDDLKDEVMNDLRGLLNKVDRSGRGVCVQASTLGSLEALLEFLKNPDPKNSMPPIPVSP